MEYGECFEDAPEEFINELNDMKKICCQKKEEIRKEKERKEKQKRKREAIRPVCRLSRGGYGTIVPICDHDMKRFPVYCLARDGVLRRYCVKCKTVYVGHVRGYGQTSRIPDEEFEEMLDIIEEYPN